jgi:signal transduction histidine kinase
VRPVRYGLWPACVAFGVVAEALGRPQLLVLDCATGFLLVGFGLVTWSVREKSWVGPLALLAGVAWFLGTCVGWLVYLHRGVLAQLLLVHPGRRLLPSSRLERVAIAAGYGYAAVYPVAGDSRVTLVFAAALVALAARRPAHARGLDRRACRAALAAALVFGFALALAALHDLFSIAVSGASVLAVYDVAVCVAGALVCIDLLVGSSARSAVAGVVVDLGHGNARTLTESLARTLGDPSLMVGYWLPGQRAYVDEAGRAIDTTTGARSVTSVADDDGAPLAVIIHDAAVFADPALVAGVSAALRLAIANVRLQADVRARAVEVEASRRRIVEAGDEQRRRLEAELRSGAEQRLARVAGLLVDDPELSARLSAARKRLRELARGIHPGALSDGGLAEAVAELAARSPIRVDVAVPSMRFPPAVEAAAYFVCSEALANAAKYANASRAVVRVEQQDARVRVVVSDDGVGGADLQSGTGLRGLADRLEAIGGRLQVDSVAGHGTELVAELPLGPGG